MKQPAGDDFIYLDMCI